MEKIDAITALGALAQETRLDIFRYLLNRVREQLARRAVIVPWLTEEPKGPRRLRRLAGGAI